MNRLSVLALFLVAQLSIAGGSPGKEGLVYAPVGEGDHLVQPVDLVIGEEGRLYLLDAGAQCVYVWNKDGSYHGKIGRDGDGPGEFRFKDYARSEISFNGRDIIVLDDKAKKWHVFRHGKHIETRNKNPKRGRIPFFECLPNGKLVVWEQEHRGKTPMSVVYITDTDWQERKVLLEYEDKMYIKNKNDGWDFNPAAPLPSVHADFYDDRIIVGDSVSPTVTIFNADGERQARLKVGLTEQEFTPEDRKDVLKTYKWLKPPHRLISPENHRLYDLLFPMENGLLACRYVPNTGSVEGVLSQKGKRIGTFAKRLGDFGGLVWTNQTFFGVLNNAEGEFEIQQFQIPANMLSK